MGFRLRLKHDNTFRLLSFVRPLHCTLSRETRYSAVCVSNFSAFGLEGPGDVGAAAASSMCTSAGGTVSMSMADEVDGTEGSNVCPGCGRGWEFCFSLFCFVTYTIFYDANILTSISG